MLKAAGSDSSSWEELFPSGITEDWEVWSSSLAAQDFFFVPDFLFPALSSAVHLHPSMAEPLTETCSLDSIWDIFLNVFSYLEHTQQFIISSSSSIRPGYN